MFCSFSVSNAQIKNKTYYNNNAFKPNLYGPVTHQKLTVIIPTGVPDLRDVGQTCYILEESYNADTLRSVSKVLNLENVEIGKSEILHDANGFKTEILYTDIFNNLLNRVTYEYDKKKNWKRSVNYDKYYNPASIIYYTYVPDNNKIAEIRETNEDGTLLRMEVFVYNESNLISEKILVDSVTNKLITTEYLYDNKNKLISYREIDNNNNLLSFMNASYINDTLNNITIENFDNNKPSVKIEYLYDPLGNIIKTTETDYINKSPAIISEYIYEWDLWGNWTKQLIKKNGEITVAAEREIEYFIPK